MRYVRTNLRMYERDSERWKTDHREAMALYDFEDYLQFGIDVFDGITHWDEAWSLRVHKGLAPYRPEHESTIREAYGRWLRPCEAIEQVLRQFEAKFGQVKHAEEFRRRCREAYGIAANDAEFFRDDALVSLRDDAVDEHRRGETTDGDCRG